MADGDLWRETSNNAEIKGVKSADWVSIWKGRRPVGFLIRTYKATEPRRRSDTEAEGVNADDNDE